jgi:hypothetical protein
VELIREGTKSLERDIDSFTLGIWELKILNPAVLSCIKKAARLCNVGLLHCQKRTYFQLDWNKLDINKTLQTTFQKNTNT